MSAERRGGGRGRGDGRGGGNGDAGSAREDDQRSDPDPDVTVVDTLPALARLAAGLSVRTAARGVTVSLRLTGRLARTAVEPQTAIDLVQEVSADVRGYVREFLGVAELDAQVRQLMPGGDLHPALRGPSAVLGRKGRLRDDVDVEPELLLRTQGAELLRASADVTVDDRAHPAYARILEELAPDEARILRLLAMEGPQPAVDVRSANLIGVGSQLVARSLNMIGPSAGLRRSDRIPSYLNNLYRLGLIWFSEEALADPSIYQVLEAQPEVLETIKGATRAKSIHRSIQLTPFGKDFCDVCLPLDVTEVEELTEGT
jgi:hypothetical protein